MDNIRNVRKLLDNISFHKKEIHKTQDKLEDICFESSKGLNKSDILILTEIVQSGLIQNRGVIEGYQETALLIACSNGNTEAVKLLLDYDTYICYNTNQGCINEYAENSLLNAVDNNHLEIVKLLIEHKDGYDVENDEDSLMESLVRASNNGYIEIIKYICKYEFGHIDDRPIQKAVNDRDIEIIKILLKSDNRYKYALKTLQLINELNDTELQIHITDYIQKIHPNFDKNCEEDEDYDLCKY